MKKGKVICFPTDTVYGLGTPLLDFDGIKRIYDIKGRNYDKPIAVLCSSMKQIEQFAVMNDEAKIIGKAFWPGALTLILPTKPSYYEKTGEKTIGVRIPNHLTALKIIKKLGPMKTTSMNQSGEKELNDYQEIKDKYGHLLNKVYPNDQEILKIASTVVLITDEIKILREGSITKEMIVKSLKK